MTDWMLFVLVPFAGVYLGVCMIYLRRARVMRKKYDPWEDSRPNARKRRGK